MQMNSKERKLHYKLGDFNAIKTVLMYKMLPDDQLTEKYKRMIVNIKKMGSKTTYLVTNTMRFPLPIVGLTVITLRIFDISCYI